MSRPASPYLLQLEWDARLINAWRDNRYMGPTCSRFRAKNKLEFEDFIALRRTPRIGAHNKMPVRAFVALALPSLSAKLWANDSSRDVDLLMSFTDTKLDCGAGGRLHRDQRELLANDKRAGRIKVVDVHLGHRRRDWEVCK